MCIGMPQTHHMGFRLSNVGVTFLQPRAAATLLGSVSLLSEYFLPRTWPRLRRGFLFVAAGFDAVSRAFRYGGPSMAALVEFDADLFFLPPDHLARAGSFAAVKDQSE